MSDIVKNYGPAIGPALAFVLGFLAMYLKHMVDERNAASSTRKKLDRLMELFLRSKPPSRHHPRTASGLLLHADEARNIANVARFYSKALAVQRAAKNLEPKVQEHCTYQDVIRLSTLLWSLGHLIKEVEDFREKPDSRVSEFMIHKLNSDWTHIQQNFANTKDAFEYA